MCGKLNPMKFSELEAHIGQPRLQAYVVEARGDQSRAVALYLWNQSLAAAFFVDLGHMEVALRNALHDRMSARHARLGRVGSWLDDPVGELGRDLSGARRPRHKAPYSDIARARGRVQTNGKLISDGQILSETSLGLWHQLVGKKQTALWPDLAGAFPHAPSRRRETIADPVERLRDLRNRIGHHHRIGHLPVAARYSDLLDVVGFIGPSMASWVDANSRVGATLNRRP